MLGLSRLTVHSVKTTRTLFPVKNYIFGTTYTTAARWYNSRRNDKVNDQELVAKKILENREKMISHCFAPSYPTCSSDKNPRCNPEQEATSEVCKKSNYIKFGPPPECFSPPPPPPPNASKLKYLLGAALLATGGLGLKDDEVEKPKTEEVKVVEQPLAPVVEKRERRLRRPVPETSAEIPKEIPYLLIGGGTASFAASRAIKGHDAKAKVMIITNETDLPYMRPPLSKEVWYNKDGDDPLKFRQWNGNERSLYFEPDDFFIDPKKLPELENGGVTVVRGYGVTKIDVAEGKAILTDGTEIKYGKCLIATGAKPKNLDIFESAPLAIKERLTLFRSIEDYEHLKDSLRGKSKVAVIGGGFLGTEISCALTKYAEVNNQPLEIVQVFYEDANLGRVLPQYLSNWTMDRVREEGVTVIPKTQVQGVSLHNQQIKLTLLNNSSILVDHIVVAVGSEANTDLAKTSNLEVDPILGGFLVNAELMARSNLYVAGDAACFYDPKLGRRRIEHHDHAVVSGRLAGENMVGMHKPYTHQSMFWSDLGPVIGFEGIGIVDSSLPTVGIFAKQTPEDTPQADKTDKLQAGEPIKSENSQSLPAECKPGNPKCEEDFSKGVIFYLKDEKVVGVLLWNVFNRINTARKIVVQNTKYEDLNELAKLFNLHGSYSSEE